MKAVLIWIACVLVGAAAGFLIGWVIFQLGFVVIGSTVAMAGAGIGGILVLYAYLRKTEAF